MLRVRHFLFSPDSVRCVMSEPWEDYVDPDFPLDDYEYDDYDDSDFEFEFEDED